MILLKKLQLTNFLSHEKTEIEFSETEKLLLDGNSGAGKSSIFDAILWCLYGQGRTENRSMIRKGSKKGAVCLELTKRDGEGIKDEIVVITRTVATNGKHTLEIGIRQDNGFVTAKPVSGIRETQAWIEKELIGASWLLFINSVAYVQGNTDSFVAQTASRRKELLLEIIKAEDYKQYYEKARVMLSSMENTYNSTEGQIDALRGVMYPIEARIAETSSLVAKLNQDTVEDMYLHSKMVDLEMKRDALIESMQELVLINANLKTATENRNFVEKMLLERRQDISEKDKLVKILDKAKGSSKKLEKAKKELDELRKLFQTTSAARNERDEFMSKKPFVSYRTIELGRIEEKIKKLKSEPVCPSGKDCPYSGDHSKQIDELDKESRLILELVSQESDALDAWEKKLTELPSLIDVNEVLTSINDAEESIKMLEIAERQIDSFRKDLENIEGIEKKIPEIEETLKEKQEYVNTLEKQKKEAEKIAKPKELVDVDEKLKEVKDKEKVVSEEIIKTTTKLEAINNDEEELKTISDKVAILEEELVVLADKMKKVGLTKTAFGSKGGIETLVIDYLLPKLEDRVNEILSKLSDFRIKFDTQKKSADGEGVVEGLFITILNTENEELPYENYSGGEKLKISVAISEALATLQKVGFRLFDEAIFALDDNSLESFVDVVEKLLTSFPQMMMISHIQNVKDLFDKKITIIKTNNKSHVQ